MDNCISEQCGATGLCFWKTDMAHRDRLFLDFLEESSNSRELATSDKKTAKKLNCQNSSVPCHLVMLITTEYCVVLFLVQRRKVNACPRVLCAVNKKIYCTNFAAYLLYNNAWCTGRTPTLVLVGRGIGSWALSRCCTRGVLR